jgi:hypothetical protein
MKKLFILSLVCLLLLHTISSELIVEKSNFKDTMILDVNKTIELDLKITNTGEADTFEIYNLLGFRITPSDRFYIGENETKNLHMTITPIGDFNYNGAYTLTYYIKGQNSETKEELTFKAIQLKDAFEIDSESFDSSSEYFNVYIHSKINYNFDELEAQFSSLFFETKEDFSLGPNQRKDFRIKLDKNQFKDLSAGFYTYTVKITYHGTEADIERNLKFNEKSSLTTTQQDYGIIIRTQVIEKTNEGNTILIPEVSTEKNIFTTLFTSFSPAPDIVDRQGTRVEYIWNQKINPGETLRIVIKTNWLFPIISILFVILLVIVIKMYSKTGIILKKKVSFVKTKGGEFALKVTLIAKAADLAEKVNVIDRLPSLVKIHERFGGERPTRIDEKTRRIEWNFERLEKGEARVMSYIIYSKVGILGKFALPSATAIYEQDGKIRESTSNRAFFVSETKKE